MQCQEHLHLLPFSTISSASHHFTLALACCWRSAVHTVV